MGAVSFDAAIVGAGPAGAWAALMLARAGARVALVDPSHPREKPCGGGVTGRALRLVAGVCDVSHPRVAIRTATFLDSRTGRSADVPLGTQGDAALTVASRSAFDAALVSTAQRAGAEVIAARVRAIQRTPTGFHLTTGGGGSLTAAFLVGADGANSLVRRTLVRPFRRDQLSIATGYFAHGRTSEAIVLEFTPDPPGYIWSFPRPDHLAIGICAQADAGAGAAALRARTASWIRATGIADGARLEPYAWPIPSLSAQDFEALDVAGPGWCLVGDAAGLVDPITREGIYFAMQSATFAADAIAADLARAPRAYTDRVRAEIGSDLARAARFKATFFRTGFTALLMEALTSSAPIREVVADLVAGVQPYRTLKWRLAKTMELGLALRAITALR